MNNRKIVSYHVYSLPAEEMDTLIEEYLMDGWQPYGSPSSMMYVSEIYITQAFAKYEETACVDLSQGGTVEVLNY